MKLLLDTHIWVWSFLEPEKLSHKVLSSLRDSENELWLSPISIWEFLLLCEKKRLQLDENPSAWVNDVLELAPMKEASFTLEVALALSTIGIPHRDPADRFLVATAHVHGLTLVTADELLISSKVVPTLSNLS